MSEGLAEEMLLEFFNAVEAGIVAARMERFFQPASLISQ